MANPVPAGCDESSGTDTRTPAAAICRLSVTSTKHLLSCPYSSNGHRENLSGGESVDPYPGRWSLKGGVAMKAAVLAEPAAGRLTPTSTTRRGTQERSCSTFSPRVCTMST